MTTLWGEVRDAVVARGLWLGTISRCHCAESAPPAIERRAISRAPQPITRRSRGGQPEVRSRAAHASSCGPAESRFAGVTECIAA